MDNRSQIPWKILIYGFLVIVLMQAFAFAIMRYVPPLFEVKSLIMFGRPAVSMPQFLGEVGSNRWIWVRNGLATKEAVITDQLLRTIFMSEKILKERFQKGKEKNEKNDRIYSEDDFLDEIRKNIVINFTGADVYSFWVEVRDHDPELALRINKFILDELKSIETLRPIRSYHDASLKLQVRLAELRAKERRMDPSLASQKNLVLEMQREINSLEATLNQLHIAILLLEAEGDARQVLIVEPKAARFPIWPKVFWMHGLAGFFGAFVALLLLYLDLIRRRRLSQEGAR